MTPEARQRAYRFARQRLNTEQNGLRQLLKEQPDESREYDAIDDVIRSLEEADRQLERAYFLAPHTEPES